MITNITPGTPNIPVIKELIILIGRSTKGTKLITNNTIPPTIIFIMALKMVFNPNLKINFKTRTNINAVIKYVKYGKISSIKALLNYTLKNATVDTGTNTPKAK